MARSFSLVVDVKPVDALADRLQQFTGRQIVESNVHAINEVTERTYELARNRITVGINLSDDYLRRKMEVTQATVQKPEAKIKAAGQRNDLTVLGRYDAQMVLMPKRYPNRYRGKNKLPIPTGSKQQGTKVQVTRGSVKTIPNAFVQPLRAGNVDGGNGFGVFRREGDRVKHLYGPSVYQLFAHQIETQFDAIGDDLSKTVGAAGEVVLKEILK